MRKNMRKFLSVILSMVMVMVNIVPIFGKNVTQSEIIHTAKETYFLPLWHYSGGYWIIGSGAGKEKVTDKDVTKVGGIEDYLNENYTSAEFSIPIPDTVKKALAEGSTINVKYESRGQADWENIFEKKSLTVTNSVDCGGNFEFSLTPIFRLVRDRNYTDFVDNLEQSIPLIHSRYGFNMYSIYGNGKKAVQANGYYNEGNSKYIYSPFIHPSMIMNTEGQLASGYPITLNDSVVASDGYCVGDGTFSASGAVGIQFEYPINVVFEKVTTTWVDDPVTPESSETGTADPGNGGTDPRSGNDPGNNGSTENVSDKVKVDAILNLPAESHAGHPVYALDVSEFSSGGEDYTAIKALTEGLATHSFDAPGAHIGKETITDAELIYDYEGTYPVTLNVETSTGDTDSDSKCVKILPCPDVSVNLGGTQKQNRKQTLDIIVQQHPSYPVKSLTITVTEPESGETISISRNFSGDQSAPANTDHIKYRSLRDTGSDKYSITCSLDFLSKFDADKTFRYTVTAVDNRGVSDTETAEFKVIKDTPPMASIDIEPIYYRSKGSNTAVITVSDGSGAGNYQRVWTYEGTNFTDLSFGSARTVSFERSGVGTFSVGLTVTDMWTEETLEEYIVPEDHLSAKATASSLVGNIAPVVSFEMNKEKTAELLLLARDEETKKLINAALPALKTKLAAEGINARIAVERQMNSGNGISGEMNRLGNIDNDLGTIGTINLLDSSQTYSEFWTSGHISADSSAIYAMDSGNVCIAHPGSVTQTLKRTYPYTITAYDSNLNKLWNFKIYENQFFSASDFCNARLAHDAQGKYLYLISDGNTLILNKSDGSLYRTVPQELGYGNYVCGQKIYTVRDDGVFCLDPAGWHQLDALQCLTGESAVRLIKGTICFIAKGGDKLTYCSFDPETEEIRKTTLNTPASSAVIAMDTRGYAVIRETAGNFKVFDSSGKQVGSASMSRQYSSVVPSYDASGRINYVCGSQKERISFRDETASYNNLAICSLFTSYSDTASVVTDGGTYRNAGNVEFAFEYKDGTVSMTLPCHVYSLSYTIYDSQISYSFRPSDKTKTYGILISSGLPTTHFSDWFEGGFHMAYFNTSVNDIAVAMKQQESEADELVRLKSKWLRGDCDVSLCLSFGGDFNADGLLDQVRSNFCKPEPVVKTYGKGQRISYDVYYSDWEDDPSKASYWVYTHEPGTDGLWEKSGKVLTAPVTSFEKNGKYTLTHWQTDNAGRGLTEAYDKDSAPCAMFFYITGGSGGSGNGSDENKPPAVDSISTDPKTIYTGDNYSISVTVSDPDSTSLDVKVEVYRKGETVPFKIFEKEDLKSTGGAFPTVKVTDIPKAEAGTYQIAVTVSDGDGTATGSYAFTPKIKASLSGSVFHTDSWDSNRQNFNIKYFGKAYGETTSDYGSYRKAASPRIRGKNVFWPGEELQLAASLKGDVVSVKASMVGTSYSAVLKSSGKQNADGSMIFTGTMYDKSMQKDLAKDNPRQVTIRFTASFADGSSLSYDVPIIFDQDIGYWMIHRTK